MQNQISMTSKKTIINLHLKKLIPLVNGPHALLFQAARYSILLPGKRLRPRLLFNVLEDYGIPIEEGLDAACSIEMIHTYSMIHDDLPSMDNDSLRRGKPTLHKVYGEAQAILAGDFLLTRAFEVIAKHPDLVSILAARAGGYGMVGGQMSDILNEGKHPDWETLKFTYIGKTASLFSAALECGAVIANASKKSCDALKHVGEFFGIAFQIQDDLLDEITTEKTAYSDITNQKATSLTLFSKEKAKELSFSYLNQALNHLPKTMPFLEETLCSYFHNYNTIDNLS